MASNISGLVDWQWMSQGDILLAGGDIATTDPTTLASLQDMVRTRLKASLHGWQLYPIGADLQARLGDTINAELNTTLRRQVNRSLTNQFLPNGSFIVKSLTDNGLITIFVYLNQSLIAAATLNPATGAQSIT
ncbi:MAG: hypothetical protein WA766_11735 [Candidatus Acidiferrales bacterium]